MYKTSQGTQVSNGSNSDDFNRSSLNYSADSTVCVIGSSHAGPAFVPTRVTMTSDFDSRFVLDNQDWFPARDASNLWAGDLTFTRVLGIGNGEPKNPNGTVDGAGFIVGNEQPEDFLKGTWGSLSKNPFAFEGGPPGRTYFLGTFMSSSHTYSKIGIQGEDKETLPFIRGVLMAPSGVVLTLKNSLTNIIDSNTASSDALSPSGSSLGTIMSSFQQQPTSQFVLLLNGHKPTNEFPSIITASFDRRYTSEIIKHFSEAFNTDPHKIQEAGHYLYSHWEHESFQESLGNLYTNNNSGFSPAVFILTGSCDHNSGSKTVPNYEGFNNRFENAKTPWIVSQKIKEKRYNLFRLHLIDSGAGQAERFYFTIKNLDFESDYPRFDLHVIDSDTSEDLLVFDKINLNPGSNSYIEKHVGDVNLYLDIDRLPSEQRIRVDGKFLGKSLNRIIRVEVHSDVENMLVPREAIPVGFRGISHLVTSGSNVLSRVSYPDNSFSNIVSELVHVKEPPLPLRLSYEDDQPWGVEFVTKDTNSQNWKGYVKYFPDFRNDFINFSIGDNSGQPETAENGILDSDVFNYNMFTLENLNVVENNEATPKILWEQTRYVRDGSTLSGYRKIKLFPYLDSDLRNERNLEYLKFSFFAQGGFDGVNIFNYDDHNLTNLSVTADEKSLNRTGNSFNSYRKAMDIIDKEGIDFSLFSLPGIRCERITNKAATLAEDNGYLYLMDIWPYDSYGKELTSSMQTNVDVVTTALNFSNRRLNSSYVSTYFPDIIRVVDTDVGQQYTHLTPASAAALSAISLNDRLGFKWYAPAGEQRGYIDRAVDTLYPDKLKYKFDFDNLYDNGINPIIKVSKGSDTSVVVWGQKTTSLTINSLKNVNIRRLLLDMRKRVRNVAETYFFEPYTEETRESLRLNIANLMEDYKKKMAIDDYQVALLKSTPADIDRGLVSGRIVFTPHRSNQQFDLELAEFWSRS